MKYEIARSTDKQVEIDKHGDNGYRHFHDT